MKTVLFDKEVSIQINDDVLKAIYSECDKYDIDETGGRLLGFIQDSPQMVSVEVCALLESGPAAKRTRTSFFQDGGHQEQLFREIEQKHSKIEHLGNWHTHHVNGLTQLSGGDIDTYTKTVNHKNHNIDYFYALLVVSKNDAKYEVRHFLFRRNDSEFYEIPNSSITISNRKSIYLPSSSLSPNGSATLARKSEKAAQIRVSDNLYMSQLFPKLRPFLSKQSKSLYWKGRMVLVDNSEIEVLVLENIQENDSPVFFSVAIAKADANRFVCKDNIKDIKFQSAIEALTTVERICNKEVFSSGYHAKEKR